MEEFLFPLIGLFATMVFVCIFMSILKYFLDPKRRTRINRRSQITNILTQQHTNIPYEQTHETPVINNSDFDDLGIIPGQGAASPVVVPPYPVEPRHPTPHAGGPPPAGFATHNPPYPIHTSHPVPAAMYYPPPVGTTAPYPPISGHTPYPPATAASPYPPAGPPTGGSAPYPDYGAQPPSYSEAVSQPRVQPISTKEGYSKQAPYNPNY